MCCNHDSNIEQRISYKYFNASNCTLRTKVIVPIYVPETYDFTTSLPPAKKKKNYRPEADPPANDSAKNSDIEPMKTVSFSTFPAPHKSWRLGK